MIYKVPYVVPAHKPVLSVVNESEQVLEFTYIATDADGEPDEPQVKSVPPNSTRQFNAFGQDGCSMHIETSAPCPISINSIAYGVCYSNPVYIVPKADLTVQDLL